MKNGDLLFVYGSLRKGEGSDLSLQSGAKFVAEDRINGDIYRCGWYPGLKLNHDDKFWDAAKSNVKGEVYQITDEALIRHLDAYEGYPLLFSRKQVTSMKDNIVWVYTYNGDVAEDRKVPTGDWSDRKQSITSSSNSATSESENV